MQTGLVVYIESCLAPTVIQNIKDNALYRRINPDKFQIPITHRNQSRFFVVVVDVRIYSVCVRCPSKPGFRQCHGIGRGRCHRSEGATYHGIVVYAG